MDQKQVWRTIRKGLEYIGRGSIIAAFEANKRFEWFVKALDGGAFEEQSHEPLNGNELIASQTGSHQCVLLTRSGNPFSRSIWYRRATNRGFSFAGCNARGSHIQGWAF
jgi:hypothetical protein